MKTGRLSGSQASAWVSIYLLITSMVSSNVANAAGGDLLWRNIVDGGANAGDSAEAVAVFGGMVFATGALQKLGLSAFAIRAYDAETGALVWKDRPDGEPAEDIANDVDASEHGVAVCGRVDGGKFGVRFYNLTDGHLLWEDRSQSGSAAACETLGNTVYVVGLIRNSATGPDFAVRAYDAATGSLLWEDQFDGGAEVADQARAFAISSGHLYVVGGIQQTAGDDDMVIRRYDAETGALVWHQVFAGAAGERDEAFAVTIVQSRVFVAGRASLFTGSFGSTWAVQAYSADTGELLWADYREQQEVNAIVAQDERVIAVGARQSGQAVVRAYEPSSGNILWRNAFGSSFSSANAIDTDGQLAYVGGHVSRSVMQSGTLIVRAIDLTTGATVWQARFKSSSAGGSVNDLVVVSDRVYAVGLTAVATLVKDFLVRVYDAQ
jgi:outer membrane protein assembly factor BamB